MKMLVTGGCGFIGSNYIRYVLERHPGARVMNLDKLTYCGNPDNLRDIEDDRRYEFIKGDICDKDIVGRAMRGCDTVINFAAESHVDRSINNAAEFINTNFRGVHALLESARKMKVKRFVQVSTDEVYGSIEKGSFRETDMLCPNSPYSASKAAGDHLALSYWATFALPVIITRSSNNFGPYQFPEKMIPLFVTNLLENKKVPLYGDGLNVRDWLYVLDNCAAIDRALRKGRPGEIYNIGGGVEIENARLTKMILGLLGKRETMIKYVPDRPGHDRRYSLDSGKMRRLGWRPTRGFDEALRETVDWYEKNKKWWGKIKKG
ncbi:MAG: dTDP-glucose 4,6-dehydratase [Candidatus Omnitrophota bacterium]